MAADELARRPALAENQQWRATRRIRPRSILALLGKGCFWIPPHPAHRHDRDLRDRWVAAILNQPGWAGDWWRH